MILSPQSHFNPSTDSFYQCSCLLRSKLCTEGSSGLECNSRSSLLPGSIWLNRAQGYKVDPLCPWFLRLWLIKPVIDAYWISHGPWQSIYYITIKKVRDQNQEEPKSRIAGHFSDPRYRANQIETGEHQMEGIRGKEMKITGRLSHFFSAVTCHSLALCVRVADTHTHTHTQTHTLLWFLLILLRVTGLPPQREGVNA